MLLCYSGVDTGKSGFYLNIVLKVIDIHEVLTSFLWYLTYFEWIYEALYLISESCSEEIRSTCNDKLIL